MLLAAWISLPVWAHAGTLLVPETPSEDSPLLTETIWPVLTTVSPTAQWSAILVRPHTPGQTVRWLRQTGADGALWAELDRSKPTVVVKLMYADDGRTLEARIPVVKVLWPLMHTTDRDPFRVSSARGALAALSDAVRLRAEFLLAAPARRPTRDGHNAPSPTWTRGPPPLPQSRLQDLELPPPPPMPERPAIDIPQPPAALASQSRVPVADHRSTLDVHALEGARVPGSSFSETADRAIRGSELGRALRRPETDLTPRSLSTWTGLVGLVDRRHAEPGLSFGATLGLTEPFRSQETTSRFAARFGADAFVFRDRRQNDRWIGSSLFRFTLAGELRRRGVSSADLADATSRWVTSYYLGVAYDWLRLEGHPDADLDGDQRAGAIVGASITRRLAGPFEASLHASLFASPWGLSAGNEQDRLFEHEPVQLSLAAGIGWALGSGSAPTRDASEPAQERSAR